MANDIGGVWRTIGGRRVFIKDGQSLADAMKASGKFNNKKDIEHQQRKINNDISRNMFDKKEQEEKEKEYDAYEELKKEKTLADVYSYTDKQIEEGKNPLFNRAAGKDKELLAQIQEETDSYAYKELLGEYNAGKVTTADLEDTLKTLKKFNGDNEDKISAKQFKEASKIDEPLERAIQMQVADDVGKTLNDDDIRFRAENYIKNNYNGKASTEEIFEKLKSAYKNNGIYENNKTTNMTTAKNYDKQALSLSNGHGINESISNLAYNEEGGNRETEQYINNLIKANNSSPEAIAKALNKDKRVFNSNWEVKKVEDNVEKKDYNVWTNKTTTEKYDKQYTLESTDKLGNKKILKVFAGNSNELMTAEQLKGKDRTEQKEINKQYLKEQNKLAKEKGLINDYNKTDSRGSMSDDSFIEQARKNGMSDEQIAKEVYKKHNGPESNNTSDNNIKRLLAKQAKEEALAKGDKKRAESFENYEKNFAEREKRDKMGQYAYLLEKQRNRNNNNDEKTNELQNKANKVVDSFKNQSSDNQFTMYNSQYDKEVTVKKGADGKWVDSDGNKYMGYLSKQDVKQYFKGNWKESTEKRTASEIISSQMSKTRNAKIEVANALGLKYDNDNEWKSTSQLYKEQKGKDIVNIAIDSSKADKYNAFVKKNYNREDKNFSDRAYIDKYAKDNNLDADALYYMTKIASESDRTKLKKKAFELYKKQHPNTKKTIYSFEDDIK